MNICIITSNIRFDNPSDGINAWASRRQILAQTLLSHRPDIIATQEGRFGQLKDFEKLLVDYSMIDHHRSWIKTRMYPTFFVKNNLFEILRSQDLWLSETPHIAGSSSFGSAFPRLLTWMKIQPKDSRTHFLIVNTHLDHIEKKTRQRQIQVLVEEIKRIQDQSSHLIILGDFNDHPESHVREIIMSSFPELRDSWKLFNSHEETTHHAFNGECQNGARIDWILVDKRIKLEDCFLDKNLINGLYPSDHFPVICRFSL